jgi:hypothetical protein
MLDATRQKLQKFEVVLVVQAAGGSDNSDTRFFLGGSNCGPSFNNGFNSNPCGRRKRQVRWHVYFGIYGQCCGKLEEGLRLLPK